MSDASTGQVNTDAAKVYDEFFVPALFEQWAPRIVARSGIGLGDRVLDVGCGTGVLARAAAKEVGNDGSVMGVDINDGMLAVAGPKAPEIDWRNAAAESLPFADATFERVMSQFGLMFFTDRVAAIREMLRVLRPGGRLVVSVWASLDETPGYAAMVQLLRRLFGAEVAAALEAPYCLGDPDRLRRICLEAAAPDPRVETVPGTCIFPSLEQWVQTDVKGWTLADLIDDAQLDELRREAPSVLGKFVRPDGKVEFEAPARLVLVTK